jgi:DNA-binding phage protein
MSKHIKVAGLPEFDAAHYLDSETSIAAYLTDILEANDAALWLQPWVTSLAPGA